MVDKLARFFPLVSAGVSLTLALLTLIPEFVSGIDLKWRVLLIIVTAAIGAWIWNYTSKQKNKQVQLDERLADGLLRAIQTHCTRDGDSRITLFRESYSENSGEVLFQRIRRVAFSPDLTDGGTCIIPAKRSVLREAVQLPLGDRLAPPVDERQNFQLEHLDHDGWLEEQRRFVGDRAESLRMKSCSYGWRRIEVPDEVAGGAPHLLLIESTARLGINRKSLDEFYIDSIVVEVLKALKY